MFFGDVMGLSRGGDGIPTVQKNERDLRPAHDVLRYTP